MGVADDHMCVHPEGREARLGSEKLQSAVTRAALREIIQLTQFKELSEQIMVEDNERFKDEEVAALHRLRARGYSDVIAVLKKELYTLSVNGS